MSSRHTLDKDAAFLSIRNLTVHYGPLMAVRGMSMEVEWGVIVSLLGANGSGKSTILKTISGIKRPTSGEVWFEGKRIDGLSPPQIVRLGIAQVPEGRRLFPYMTVLENLKMGAYSRKDKEVKQTMEEMFEHFPVLKERRNYKAQTLSGGEQEMVAIARCLMARPRFLLMDEPLQGLAPLVIDEIERIIYGLNADGITLLLVEHNVHMALGLADKVYILDSGKVAHEGSPEEM
ncbi:MAG: ABC transporter ATP-binding protein [Deltaproteobacteria bacterium]|nr:ABC transporter ATP-binding protein [Deltaproteobacteria bacterium]